ncbi:MAG: mechanosensitive ion channel family protein [Cyanobacteria bacterium J06638_28]
MTVTFGTIGWALMLGIPLLAISLSEVIERLHRRKIPVASALRSFRNITLPLLSAILIWRYILQGETNSQLFHVIETLLWLSLLGTGLLLVNTLFTARSKRVLGKIRVPTLYLLVGRILVVGVCAIYILANIWQVDLVRITSALGVGSLVIALALQDTLSNLVSGFLLLIDRPFNEGDWIQIGDIEAEVLEINWRSVRLRNRNRDIIAIPNGELGKATILNYTLLDLTHAEKVNVSFAYGDPPNLVKQVLHKAVAATEGIVDSPRPKIRVLNYLDFSIEYQIKCYLVDYEAKDDICSELRTHIYYTSKRHGLEIPYPISMEYEMPPENLQPPDSFATILETLQSLSYFKALDTTRLNKLAQSSLIEVYGTGEEIVSIGEVNPGFFVIQKGVVAFVLEDDNGVEQEITQLTSGGCFGEQSVLGNEPSLVTIKVLEDLVVVRIPPAAIATVAERNIKFARDINQLIDDRIRAVRVTNFNQQSGHQSYLSRLFTS